MTEHELEREIRAIDHEHRNDGDGGHATVKAIVDFADRRTPDDRTRLGSVLLRLVDSKDPSLWGVSLESLVLGWPSDAATGLAILWDRLSSDDDRRPHAALALVRMKHRPIAASAIDWMEKRLQRGDLSALPVVAAMVHLDADAAMRLATEAFRGMADEKRRQAIQGYVPAFVWNFVEANPALLAELVNSVSRRTPSAGQRLRDQLLDDLSKPWVLDRVNVEQRESLCAQIRAATNFK